METQFSQLLVRMPVPFQCFNMFRVRVSDFFLCCGRERCPHSLQSRRCCHHFQDGVQLGHGNDFFDGCHGNGCSKTASKVDK